MVSFCLSLINLNKEMKMSNNGNDDNIAKLKGGKEPTAREKALAALEKGRKEGFENRMKEKVKVLLEQQKAVRITEKEIDQMQNDFDEGL